MQKVGICFGGYCPLHQGHMDVIMKAFSAMGKMAKEESGKGEFRYEELIDGTMVVLLRGIATPKGMEKLEKYRNKNK